MKNIDLITIFSSFTHLLEELPNEKSCREFWSYYGGMESLYALIVGAKMETITN